MTHNTKIQMNIRFIYVLFLGFISLNTFAQEAPKAVWADSIQIDGDLTDWENTTFYTFKDQDFSYSIANDANNLYIAIRVPNKIQQLKAIYNGISVTTNSEAKEKAGPTVVFPMPDVAALRAMNSKEEYEKAENNREAGLNLTRAISVHDFPTIIDGRISLENNYGIRTTAKIDPTDDALIYEAAISIKQLNINKDAPFALNLRINDRSSVRFTNRSTDIYGQYTGMRSGVTTKVEPGVWNILKLAKSN